MPFIRKNSSPGDNPRYIFVGRTTEVAYFTSSILQPDEVSHNIVAISGNGGVGKSTLLNHFIQEAKGPNFKEYCLVAQVNEQQSTPAAILEAFADQLSEAGHQLPEFKKALFDYKDTVHRIYAERETNREALFRATMEVAGSVVGEIPAVGGMLGKMTKPATELYLKERHTRQLIKDAERLEDPIGELTSAFVAELNNLVGVTVNTSKGKRLRRVLLFFDTFEQLAPEVAPWLLDDFLAADISGEVVLILAGRDRLTETTEDDAKRWLPFISSGTVYQVRLSNFTKEETVQFLARRGIMNPQRVEVIWNLSNGLPLYLGLLTADPNAEIDPTKDVVTNYLRWIPKEEKVKRRLAQEAAFFSRPFNQDELAAFDYIKPEERSVLYNWLVGQPFIRNLFQDGRYTYHDEAQMMFRRNMQQRSEAEYCTIRRALAEYYNQKLELLEAEGDKEIFKTAEWLELALACVYQLLLLPDELSHIQAIAQVIKARDKVKPEQKAEIARIMAELEADEPANAASLPARQIARNLRKYTVEKVETSQFLEAVNYLLVKVRNHTLFLNESLRRLYNRRGQAYRLMGKYEQAILDLDKANKLNPNDAWVFAQRGQAYRQIGKYQQAIVDLDKAIELDPNYAWAFGSRGQVYRQIGKYGQAILDLDKAIELDPNYAWAFAERGIAYRQIGKYEQAIVDLDKAIELDPNYAWAFFWRSITCLSIGKLEQALADMAQTVKLDSNDINNVWMLQWIKLCHSRPAQGLAERLLELAMLEPESYVALVCQGVSHLLKQDYNDSLKWFEQAELLDSDVWDSYFWCGMTLAYTEKLQEAISMIEKALEKKLPRGLLKPIRWLEQDKPEIYQELRHFLDA